MEVNPIDLLVSFGNVLSKSEARRLISQGVVRIEDKVISDEKPVVLKRGMILKVGKKKRAVV